MVKDDNIIPRKRYELNIASVSAQFMRFTTYVLGECATILLTWYRKLQWLFKLPIYGNELLIASGRLTSTLDVNTRRSFVAVDSRQITKHYHQSLIERLTYSSQKDILSSIFLMEFSILKVQQQETNGKVEKGRKGGLLIPQFLTLSLMQSMLSTQKTACGVPQ